MESAYTVTEDVPGMKEQMWADTLFMACIFLVRAGRDLRQPQLCDFAAKQLVLHYETLWDGELELFFHGWQGTGKNHMSGVHWGRANAWILISTLEILQALPEFKGRDAVIERMGQHIDGLCRCQRENGMFGTILEDKSSYDEVSASAGIADCTRQQECTGRQRNCLFGQSVPSDPFAGMYRKTAVSQKSLPGHRS